MQWAGSLTEVGGSVAGGEVEGGSVAGGTVEGGSVETGSVVAGAVVVVATVLRTVVVGAVVVGAVVGVVVVEVVVDVVVGFDLVVVVAKRVVTPVFRAGVLDLVFAQPPTRREALRTPPRRARRAAAVSLMLVSPIVGPALSGRWQCFPAVVFGLGHVLHRYGAWSRSHYLSGLRCRAAPSESSESSALVKVGGSLGRCSRPCSW